MRCSCQSDGTDATGDSQAISTVWSVCFVVKVGVFLISFMCHPFRVLQTPAKYQPENGLWIFIFFLNPACAAGYFQKSLTARWCQCPWRLGGSRSDPRGWQGLCPLAVCDFLQHESSSLTRPPLPVQEDGWDTSSCFHKATAFAYRCLWSLLSHWSSGEHCLEALFGTADSTAIFEANPVKPENLRQFLTSSTFSPTLKLP